MQCQGLRYIALTQPPTSMPTSGTVQKSLVDTCNWSRIRTLLISVLVVQGLYSERLGGQYVGLCVVFSVFQYTLALDCTCTTPVARGGLYSAGL